MLRRLWRRQPEPAPLAALPDLPFDAVIDLGPRDLPPGADPVAATQAVRAAVSALPGAGWINVGRHDGTVPGALPWLRVFPAGSGAAGEGPDWDRLRAAVAEAVSGALAVLPAVPNHDAPDYDALPAPALAGGFADGATFASFAGPTLATPAPLPLGEMGDVALAAALLELVLPDGAERVAARAVARFGSFAGLLSAPVRELEAMPGLGPHSVAAIKLVHATALRAAQAGLMRRVVLDDMDRLAAYLQAALARERIEQFRVLFLDAGGALIADEAQARGTVNHTPVYPREVVRRAIELDAASVVLVHNHPSGDPTPSREDVEMTAQVRRAAAALDIVVRDHLIVGNGRWLSFQEAGLM